MNTVAISLAVAACVFAGGVVGLSLHRLLPKGHLTRETQEVVRLGTGMLSVLASLVLGLLIATAKSSYDTTDQSVRSYAAELALLNETLRDYGGDAARPRDLLRSYTARLLEDGWPENGDQRPMFEDEQARLILEQVREAIRALKPVDDGQKWLQNQALLINVELLRQRWLLIEQGQRGVQLVVLMTLVVWIIFIFVSFGLNAPRNATVVAAFLICALAIGGAIFLILEMDRPLDGVMRISRWPLDNAVAHMNW